MSAKDDILREMAFFKGNGEGIESWFSEKLSDVAVEVLSNCEKRPIGVEILNQLLILSHEGGVSEGFFKVLLSFKSAFTRSILVQSRETT